MKKKTVAIALTGLLAVVALPTVAFAAGGNGWQTASEPVEQAAVTERAQTPAAEVAIDKSAPVQQVAAQGYVDADGNGVCDNAGQGNGNGQGFVDADGNGLCDNAGQGGGRGQGNGAGYVDADGNGVCDNAGQGGGRGGNGGGRGHRA
ncbi:MAG: hypothetical protein RR671_00300 [Raoultibacter sp.]